MADLGCLVVGVAADPPEKLRALVERNQLSPTFRFLSDPGLQFHHRFEVSISRRHPKARTYPEGAFLQPAVFIYDQAGTQRFEWRIQPKLTNLYGAARRMTPDEVVEQVASLAG